MPYAFRNQPLKGLYLTYTLLTLVFVRLPLWSLQYLQSSNRPRESWTLSKSLWLRITRVIIETLTQTGPFTTVYNHLAIAPAPGGKFSGVWVAPVNRLLTGVLKEWADISKVKSVRIPGYWTHKKGSGIPREGVPLPNEKVIYMLHGGAYIRCSAHPTDPTAFAQRGLLKHITCVNRIFAIEYRLAVEKPFGEDHPFPSQLIDALAGYTYLVNVVGFKPEDIIIAGDSAGGNIAHALTRYLVDYKDQKLNGVLDTLPAPPGALLLLSPWLDIGKPVTEYPAEHSVNRNSSSDYIGSRDGSVPSATAAFLGLHSPTFAQTNPYISPGALSPDLKVDFAGFPRTFILAGTAEVLYDSIKTFRDRMVKDLGKGDGIKEGDGKVRYFEVPDATHDFLVLAWCEPERTIALKQINRWVNAV